MGAGPVIPAWPEVLGEFETVRLMGRGHSIARFGDGEMKIIYGSGYVREKPNLSLSTELFDTLKAQQDGLLVGIPTLDPRSPKIDNWRRHEERFRKILPPHRRFVSAFITRPDSAPWIRTQEYLALMLSCWAGKRVTIVCEKGSKLLPLVRATAGSMRHLSCPSHGAYARIALLGIDVIKSKPDVCILSCGPTATCLARRLHGRGVQTLDLGSAGGFLLALLEGREEDPADPDTRR